MVYWLQTFLLIDESFHHYTLQKHNVVTGVNAALLYEQLNAEFEPYLHISDGEFKHLVVARRADWTHILITVPESEVSDHFDAPFFV